MRRFLVAVSVVALVAVGSHPLAAEAARLLTGRDIKDSSLTGKDIKDGSIRPRDLAAPPTTPPATQGTVLKWTASFAGGQHKMSVTSQDTIPAFSRVEPLTIAVTAGGDTFTCTDTYISLRTTGDSLATTYIEGANRQWQSALYRSMLIGEQPANLTFDGMCANGPSTETVPAFTVEATFLVTPLPHTDPGTFN